jgi:hypothetical protein
VLGSPKGHIYRTTERKLVSFHQNSRVSRPPEEKEAMSTTHRKPNFTDEQKAAIKAIQERSRHDRSGPDEMTDRGEIDEPVPGAQFLELRALVHRMKQLRERQGLSLTDVSERTDMTRAAISRLECQPDARNPVPLRGGPRRGTQAGFVGDVGLTSRVDIMIPTRSTICRASRKFSFHLLGRSLHDPSIFPDDHRRTGLPGSLNDLDSRSPEGCLDFLRQGFPRFSTHRIIPHSQTFPARARTSARVAGSITTAWVRS